MHSYRPSPSERRGAIILPSIIAAFATLGTCTEIASLAFAADGTIVRVFAGPRPGVSAELASLRGYPLIARIDMQKALRISSEQEKQLQGIAADGLRQVTEGLEALERDYRKLPFESREAVRIQGTDAHSPGIGDVERKKSRAGTYPRSVGRVQASRPTISGLRHVTRSRDSKDAGGHSGSATTVRDASADLGEPSGRTGARLLQ